MRGDFIFYILVFIMILMMLELPQFIYICVKKLIHVFDTPTHTHIKVCKSCGREGVS